MNGLGSRWFRCWILIVLGQRICYFISCEELFGCLSRYLPEGLWLGAVNKGYQDHLVVSRWAVSFRL